MTQTKVEAPFVENSRPFRNLIINGDMQIAQRGTSQTGVANNASEGYNTLDRFALNFYGNEGGVATVSQDTTVPSDTTYGKFSKSIKIDVTTADTSIGATGSHALQQNIEASFLHHSGWDYTNSSSKITLSFWARSVKAGDYCVNLQATDATRYFVAQYTLVANTWKHVEVVVPGDSNLVFNDDNGEGLQVRWMLSTGADRDGATAGSWFAPGSDYFQSTSSQVNFFDSTDNNFFLTGVQLEVGDQATNFEHLPHDVQLRRCFRYFQTLQLVSNSILVGNASATTTAQIDIHYPNGEMRDTPAVAIPTAGNSSGTTSFLTAPGAYPSTVGSHAVAQISVHFCRVTATSMSANFVAGYSAMYYSNGTNEFTFDAELL